MGPTTPEYIGGVKQRDKFLLFRKDLLSTGDHTLEMRIMNCVNQTFELDFVSYLPSFDSLATKPLPSPQSSQETASPSTTSTSKSPPAAAIAGGVVGGVVFILLILLLLCRRKIFNRRTLSQEMKMHGTCLSFFYSLASNLSNLS